MDESPKKLATQIDDFTRNLKGNTMDFLSHEREEKIDVEKPKPDVDDFLNFHDDREDIKPQEKENPVLIPTFQKPEEVQPEIDFDAIDDEFLNPYSASDLKGDLKGPSEKEKFISSEDLLTDFKVLQAEAAIETPKVLETPKPIETPKAAVVTEKPPVVEPIKPVVEPAKPVVEYVEPVKPKSAPPPAPIKKPTSDDTQIEAEKIFKSIGLG